MIIKCPYSMQDQNQPGNVEPFDNDDGEDNISSKTALESSPSPYKSERSLKVADKIEGIDIEGIEGNLEVKFPEQRKGQDRLVDAKIICEGTGYVDRSSASGSLNRENNSSEGSEQGKKRNKIVRGVKKIGLLIRREKGDDKEEFVPSPYPNIKAVNDKKIELKLILEENSSSTPSPVDRNEPESPNKRHVKDRAKSILKHAGHGVKHAFNRKGSKKSDVSERSWCSDGESISSSACTPDFVSGELNNEITR